MSNFRNYLTPGRKGHLVGIGGVSMAPLAEVLFSMGLTITGSDISEGEKVQHLKAWGSGSIRVIIRKTLNPIPSLSYVLQRFMTTIRRSWRQSVAGFPFLSGPKAGAPSCRITRIPSVLPVPTERQRRLPCAPIFSWRRRRILRL